ncbi:MAG: hypothetical protein COV46_04155 [Deltaproteobacteria bacterium CG11_big_fil_rev_8_21_14_0_20_49_13]|nr:MAG: hypothetical protein COV46_04155 [Deltaproteobacteria bacterium CG11_big_fil_rev_8_21_14_0_20_49_13]
MSVKGNHMKKVILSSIVLLLSFSAFASVVTIEGKSVIIPDDAEKTKEKALEATLQKAVEVFVAGRVTRPTADANYAKLQPALYAPFKDFVTKYEIVSEMDDPQFHYVNAKVEVDDIKVNGQLAALGIQPGVGGKPRVAVMASEQNVDGSWVRSFYGSIYSSRGNAAMTEADFNICEGSVMGAFSGAGFPVIDMAMDPTQVKKAYQYKPVFDRYDENLFNISNDNASKLARVVDNDVELVVTCTALAKSQGKTSAHMNSVLANVSCKAVNVKNNTRVAYARAFAAAPHIDPITGGNLALEKACKEVGDKLTAALADKFR